MQCGTHHSPATREKMSKAKRGKKLPPFSEEHKWKISEALKGMKRGPMSQEHKRKISKSLKGRIFTKGHVKKISKALTGRKRKPFSKEWKEKLGNAFRGKKRPPLSQQCRERMSRARKGKNLRQENPNWKGGITIIYQAVRNSDKYGEWRRRVFERDNWTCQRCVKISNGNIVAHHIRRFAEILRENKINTLETALDCELLWDIDNGMTLCKTCHSLAR